MNRKLLALLLAACVVATGASVVSGDQTAPQVADGDVSNQVTTDQEYEDGGSCDVTVHDDDGGIVVQQEFEDGGSC